MRWLLRRAWVPLTYVVVTLVMTYPAILRLGDQVITSGNDTWIFWWNNWWTKKALMSGESAYFTRHLFFPLGVDLTYHSFSWLNTGLWLVLEPLLGPIAAFNLTVLWVFPIAGWAMYCLAYDLVGSKRASFLAGLVYAFVPYRLGQLNHPILSGTQWLPFYTLFLLRAIRRNRRRAILMAGLFLVLTALVGWNLFLYSLIWTAIAATYLWLARVASLKRLIGVIGPALLIGTVVLSPLLVPLLGPRAVSEEALGDVQQDSMQTDLLAYALPNRYHPLWGRAVKSTYDGQLVKPWRTVSLGYVVMVLLGYGFLRKGVRRQTGLWWWGMLVWWVMALGPFLKLRGHIYRNIPLPYYPLSRLHSFQMLKVPDRYNAMLSLPVAVAVGYATEDLLSRLKRRWPIAVFAALSTLILFEYLTVPLNTNALEVPPFYTELAADTGKLGIVEVPIDFYDAAKLYMLYQTVHGRPIVEGHVSRRPPEATVFLDAHPLLRGLYRSQEMDPQLIDVSRQLRALSDAGFGYIIIHKKLTDAEHAAQWRDWLTISPLFEDAETAVYTTQPRFGADFEFDVELADGVGIIDSSLTASAVEPGDWLLADVRWGTRDAPQHDWLAEFALLSSSGTAVHRSAAELASGWPTSEWDEDAVVRGSAALRIDPYADGGTYVATIQLRDPVRRSPAGDIVSLGQVEIRQPERVFALPQPEYQTEAVFGDFLRLLGYDLEREGETLRLTLHWQALKRMDVSYKMFVHVIDLESGEMEAQTDVVPRDWTYPTTRWERDEVVTDEITIALSDVPGGSYGLVVGVYDPETGVRLTVAGGAEGGVLPDQVSLGKVVVR